MTKRILALALVIVVMSAAAALAVTASKTLTFDRSPMGIVTFSGKVHADAGFKCDDCHNADMFPKQEFRATPIKMVNIYQGKLCGACHNGTKAFKPQGNCAKCHKKQ